MYGEKKMREGEGPARRNRFAVAGGAWKVRYAGGKTAPDRGCKPGTFLK